ncbi:MAG: hypothetical protein PHE21_01820 [Candidatus Dojkabacteria bacterium]|nr:hypothetical protein [Candidatus Dojkabacteria bacterium]
MQIKNAQRKSAQRNIIYLTFFLLLSIPLVVFGLQGSNFDIRNKAFEDLELNEENPCLISLPNVNPYTLEVGKTVKIQIDAKLEDAGIAKLQMTDSFGNSIYQESFENAPIEIATSFNFTPSKSGLVDILGLIEKVGGGSVGCKISSPYDVMGIIAQAKNNAPEFTTEPKSSKPSQDIKTGVTYEYTLSAEDEDKDRINYHYSFTPNADWLKPTIIEDGSNGKLTIKFTGSTSEPASYLANVFIHDGYSQHLRSQSWVISVSPEKNDIPVVKVISPLTTLYVTKGLPFTIKWDSSDLNHITKYEIYITKNPTDQSSWISIKNNVSYKATSYEIPTSNLDSGIYKVIIKAIDNQTPPAYGLGISPEIVVTKTGESKPDTDDMPIIEVPQVVNMMPASSDEVTNRRVTVKTTIISSKDGQIDEDTIIFKLDDKDLTEEIKLNKINNQEYTVIYQPEKDLEVGVHKAEIFFKDTNNKEITKDWTFTISGEEESDGDTVTILGLEINKRLVIIIGIGIIVIILAIVAPIIIFSIWKEDKKRQQEEPEKNQNITPVIPEDTTQYEPLVNDIDIKEKVEEKPAEVTVQQPKTEDRFSAPPPVVEIPEPDISQDIPTDDKIKELYNQIQKTEKNNG